MTDHDSSPSLAHTDEPGDWQAIRSGLSARCAWLRAGKAAKWKNVESHRAGQDWDPIELWGVHNGRRWWFSYFPGSPTKGISPLVHGRTLFRCAPPGGERQYEMAWHFLGPTPNLLGYPATSEGKVVLGMARRRGKIPSGQTYAPARGRIVALAWPPQLMAALHSPAWLGAYSKWEGAGGSKTFPPLAFGYVPGTSVVFGIDPAKGVEVVVDALETFVEVTQTIEPTLGVPMPRENPIEEVPLEMPPRAASPDVPETAVVFRCPECGRMERTIPKLEWGIPVNLLTIDHRVPVFKEA